MPDVMEVKLLCPNSKGVCVLYFCGFVLIVTFWGMVHSLKRPIAHPASRQTEPWSRLSHMASKASEKPTFFQKPSSRPSPMASMASKASEKPRFFHLDVLKSVPGVQPKDKVILVWTKWFGQSEWPGQPAGMLPCAKYNINVSCRITYDKKEYEHSDLVAFHGRGADFDPNNLPDLSKRPPQQRWVYYNRESPINQGILANPSAGKKFNGLFNWTMTYKLDSDIDYRSFRIVPGKHPDEYHLTLCTRSADIYACVINLAYAKCT